MRNFICTLLFASTMIAATNLPSEARASGPGQPADWNQYFYYPYVYYPHNFRNFRGFNHMYYKYPKEMQIPVYRKDWYNFYPSEKPWYKGHHDILDIF